jgi:hypothetical protein
MHCLRLLQEPQPGHSNTEKLNFSKKKRVPQKGPVFRWARIILDFEKLKDILDPNVRPSKMLYFMQKNISY